MQQQIEEAIGAAAIYSTGLFTVRSKQMEAVQRFISGKDVLLAYQPAVKNSLLLPSAVGFRRFERHNIIHCYSS